MAGDKVVEAAIRTVPDFPKPGVLFYDLTGILVQPDAYARCIDRMAALYDRTPLDAIAAVEARGFLFAAPYAVRRKLPLVLVRKKGKLPGKTLRAGFALEYGEDVVEVHESDLAAGMRVLLVDDLIATGGTLRAAAGLIAQAGATVVEIFGVVGLPFLDHASALAGYRVTTLVQFASEHA
jgi:adenine phosphoribosyltransferase